jgi:hypothetical protein
MISRILFSILLVLGFSGCWSTSQSVTRSKSLNKTKRAELPFRISVTDAVNDGSSLYLRTRVQALAPWDKNYVFIRLKGFAEGERHEEVVIPLAEAIESQHPQAKSRYVGQVFKNLFLGLSLPSEGLSDYQLELIWGKEASAALSANKSATEVQVKGVQVVYQQECGNCPEVALMKGTLVNQSEVAVSAISLEVGFRRRNPSPDNAQAALVQVVEISDLNLPPGTEQDLEFEVDFTRAKDGAFIPVLQILNYQVDSE